MREDLKRLLDLQSKDAAISAVDERIAALGQELATQDLALQRAREALETARRAAAEAARRRDEMETKIESYRTLQDRRRQRLEHVRNPKEASTLMAELDLARSVMAQEENDWLRSAESVVQHDLKVKTAERNLEEVTSVVRRRNVPKWRPGAVCSMLNVPPPLPRGKPARASSRSHFASGTTGSERAGRARWWSRSWAAAVVAATPRCPSIAGVRSGPAWSSTDVRLAERFCTQPKRTGRVEPSPHR